MYGTAGCISLKALRGLSSLGWESGNDTRSLFISLRILSSSILPKAVSQQICWETAVVEELDLFCSFGEDGCICVGKVASVVVFVSGCGACEWKQNFMEAFTWELNCLQTEVHVNQGIAVFVSRSLSNIEMQFFQMLDYTTS